MFAVFKEIIFSGIYLLVIYLKKSQQTKSNPKEPKLTLLKESCLTV